MPDRKAATDRKRKLSVVISARVSPEEKIRLDAHCRIVGCTAGDLLRTAVLEVPLPRGQSRKKVAPNVEVLAKLLGEVGKIGDALQALARSGGGGPELAGQLGAVLTMRDVLVVALRRSP